MLDTLRTSQEASEIGTERARGGMEGEEVGWVEVDRVPNHLGQGGKPLQCCLIELSGLVGMFYICTVQYGSHQPFMIIEHLNSD